MKISLLLLLTLVGVSPSAMAGHYRIQPCRCPIQVDTSGYGFLALGDSYTIGESVAITERFPARTVSVLAQKGFLLPTPTYLAKTGWTSWELMEALQREKLSPPYQVVTLLIGVNDQYRGWDTSSYRIRFNRLLDTAVILAGGNKEHVFVLSIPDYSVTPFGKNNTRTKQEIECFNQINKAITLSKGISYTDITAISQLAAEDSAMIAPDGLHPSGKQYSLWSSVLANAILQNEKK